MLTKVLRQEEERFAETLENGMALLEGAIKKMKGKMITGETVFKLYDTYGFPVDLTADIARERGLKIDQAGFEKAMESQRERSRGASKFGVGVSSARIGIVGQEVGSKLGRGANFCGYDSLVGEGKVTAILKGGAEVKSAAAGEEVQIVLDSTPFYAEAGGQVGDVGVAREREFQVPRDRHEKAGRRSPAHRPPRHRHAEGR